jgi:fructosamine-3-kinase
MVNNSDWQYIAKQIEQTINRPFPITGIQPVSGGCINSAYLLLSDNNSFFIKLNQAHLIAMFEAEFAGLEELAQSNAIKVPVPILSGVFSDTAFLVLESFILTSGNRQSDEKLGQQLAALHQIKQPFFGWHLNNTIGSTEQVNTSTDDWPTFWRDRRLNFQLSFAEKNGYSTRLIQSGKKLSNSLHCFFNSHTPHPSLLHGDLWSGNASMTEQGDPIIYDPACYYGDRETDIAMTELFGGFSANFYAAYDESYPLHSGYSIRKTLYNLYHILNHLNLFGASYQQQAQNMIDSLLSEIS